LRGVGAPTRPGVFLPLVEIHTGHPYLPRGLTVVVRASEGPERVAGTLRRVVRALDAQVPLADMRPFDEVWRQALGEPRSLFGLLALFAGAGLLLGGVGTFAVATAWVVRGRREIGVRMALGAAERRVVGEVVRRGARLTVLGCVIGGVLAVMVARTVRARLLFEVAPSDPRALGAAALLLLGVGLLATLVPARRAAAVEPMRVLRED
jgi:predicted lysophospholipase L1 biosynthesis ABC-type transport system permease subunit